MESVVAAPPPSTCMRVSAIHNATTIGNRPAISRVGCALPSNALLLPSKKKPRKPKPDALHAVCPVHTEGACRGVMIHYTVMTITTIVWYTLLPLGKLLSPSATLCTPPTQSGMPLASKRGSEDGQHRATKWGRGRPTCVDAQGCSRLVINDE